MHRADVRAAWTNPGPNPRWHGRRIGASRLARDFPADSERYVIDADGYDAVVVNGEVLLKDGRHTGALPGQVLRGG